MPLTRQGTLLGAKWSLLCLAGNTLLALGFTVATLLRLCEPAGQKPDGWPFSDKETCAADSFFGSEDGFIVPRAYLVRLEAQGLLLCDQAAPVPATLLALRSWRTVLTASIRQVLLHPSDPESWAYFPVVVGACGAVVTVLCLLPGLLRPSPWVAAAIPFLIRVIGLNALPALSLATHPAGPLSSFFALFYDKSPLIMAYNSLLWWLTLPQQLTWLDLVCTWVTPLTAAINAVTFAVSVPDHVVQGLPFRPWALFWQTLAMACVVTCLHAAGVWAFHQHVQRKRAPHAAAEHGGSASTSAGLDCGGDHCWPMKRPAAVLQTGQAGCSDSCSEEELQSRTGSQAAVQLCGPAARHRSAGQEAVPALTAAHKRQEQEQQNQTKHTERVQEQLGPGPGRGSGVPPYTGLVGSEVEESPDLQGLDPRAEWGLETHAVVADIGGLAASAASGQGNSSSDDAKWMPEPLVAAPSAALPAGAGAGAATLPYGPPGSALDEALRLVRAQKLMSYIPVMECCQVHVRLEGMEPEQLQQGWQAGLAERLSEHGWCLLNVAVRRGSIYVSFTLVRAAQDNGDAGAQPATGASDADEDFVSGGQLAWGGAGAGAAGGNMELGVMAGPEQLLLQMGLRREQLPGGFSMTVQAVTDDGRLQRLRYTLQPNGVWAHEPLDGAPEPDGEVAGADGASATAVPELGLGSLSSFKWASAEGAATIGDQGLQLASGADAGLVPSMDASWGDATTPPHGCISYTNTLHSSDTAPTSTAGAVGEATEALAADASSDSRLLRVAQEILGHDREDAAVDVQLVGPVDGAARAAAPSAGGVSGLIHDVVLSAVPTTMVHRSARQPARATPVAPSTQWALQMPNVLIGAFPSGDARSGCRSHGTPLYQTVVEVDGVSGAQGAEPPLDPRGQGASASAPSELLPLLGAVEQLRFRARPLGCGGGMMSELRVEQAAVPQPAEPVGPAGKWSLVIWGGQAPESAAFRDSDADADQADATAEPRPHLVDVSLWRSHDLLAARVVLLVPPGCCSPPALRPQQQQRLPTTATARRKGAAAGPCTQAGSAAAPGRWVGELLEVLQGQPVAGAQHLLVDLGLLLSGAFDEVAAGSAPPSRAEPGQPGHAPQPGTRAGAGSAAAGLEAVLSRRLRAAQQTLLILDMGCGLLSLVLQCGAAHLADYLWRTLRGMGFGPEELLLHACGAGGDLPPLHAAVASGEPAAVDLVVAWYHAAKLPEPWLQPAAVSGAPAVLTPLVLASASSPPGALLWHTLCAHADALAAWRVAVNGVSGRATAAAAGLWRLVLAVDAYCALAPSMARAGAVLPLRFSLAGGLAWRGQHASASRAGKRRGAVPGAAACRSDANASAGLADVANASPATADTGPPVSSAAASSSAPCTSNNWKFLSGDEAVTASPTTDFNTYLARRSRMGKLVLRWTVVAFQIVSHLRALTTGFAATCPAAAAALDGLAAPSSAAAAVHVAGSGVGALTGPYALAGHALLRCVAGRYWWTAVEVLAVLWVSSPAALRKHDAVCALITVLHASYQGLEGVLLPPSGMKAVGAQMVVASIAFNLLNSYANLPSERLALVMRMLEAAASTLVYVRYGVTESLAVAACVAACVSAMGWATSVCIRRRALAAWLRELRQQQSQLQQAGEDVPQLPLCRSATVPDPPAEGMTSAAGPSVVATGATASAIQ